jgi:hypothetical protein
MPLSGSNIARSSWNGAFHVTLSANLTLPVRALKPPGYFKEWHVGVRVSSNKKLVAFISGVPMTLRVRGKYVTRFYSSFLFLC